MRGEINHYLENGTFLGSIWEGNGPEVYAVINTPKLKEKAFFLSYELTFKNIGQGKGDYSQLKKYFPLSVVLDLKPQDRVNFILNMASPSIVSGEGKKKDISYDEDSHFFKCKVSCDPGELRNSRCIPYREITAKGEIISENDEGFWVDAGLNIFIEKDSHNLAKNLKVGDWVEGKLYDIKFFDKA
ncbi:MAG: hypothetical protein PHW72_03100 [Candidatus Pacebacteria bacterium]|nr:hypothetical protein [Candidatus Paceibacterota bacterium]